MTHADPGWDREALGILVGADRGVDQLIGDQIGQLLAMIGGDDFQHQVDRGRATCRCDPVAINHKDRLGQSDILKFFGEAVLVFPMDRGAFAIQKTGLGERVARGAQPADDWPFARFPAEPVQEPLIRRPLHVNATTEQNDVIAPNLFEIVIEFVANPGAAIDHLAAFASEGPFIERLACHTVGDPQCLHRAGEAEHGKLVQQHEHIAFRLVRHAVFQAGHAPVPFFLPSGPIDGPI